MNDNASQTDRPRHNAIPFWKIGLMLLLCLGTAGICMLSGNQVNTGTEAGVVMKLPRVLGGYVGAPMEVTTAEKTILPMDTEFERSVFTAIDGQSEINCQIVLSGGEKRSIHRPEVCLPGQGWTVKTAEPTSLELRNGGTLEVMQLTIERPVEMRDGSRRMLDSLFYYWFVGSDTTTAHHYERILLTSKDRVLRNLNHRWAYVVVSSPVPGSINPEARGHAQTRKMIEDFISQVVPYIHHDKVLDKLKPKAG